MKTFCTALLLVCAPATQVLASDFVFGLGLRDSSRSDSGDATVVLEYHTDPFREYDWGTVGGVIALQVEDNGTDYLGVGVSTIWKASPEWFVEGSLTAGYYNRSSRGADLGGDFQFRTLVGVGYQFKNGYRLSVAIDHLSNAGLNDNNPGKESISMRYRMSF